MLSDSDDFLKLLHSYLAEKDIHILSFSPLRKNAEGEFLLSVPSAVGRMEFYARAKRKKRISEGDLSVAYLQGQHKNLPTLFLSTGELTKKLEKDFQKQFPGMLFLRIE